MCARGLASFSPQAPGILIIPISDVVGLGWGEVAVLQGNLKTEVSRQVAGK